MPSVVVAAGIGAAGAIGASAISSNAANKAAKTQAQGAQQATNLQGQIYQQQREDLAPYRQAGNTALSELMRQGFGGTGAIASPAPAETGTSHAVFRGTNTPVGTAAQGHGARYDPGLDTAGGRSMRLSDVFPQAAAVAQRQSGYVSMRAPDGSVQAVPPESVEHYRSRGATLA